jgi:hypothetical protein
MTDAGFDQDRRFRLGVIIVNYRTPALVEACLVSLGPQLESVNGACVVVDNASGDGSFERLSAWAAASPHAGRIKIFAAPANGGFSAGNNIGFTKINADFVLLLNSDAAAMPGALAVLLDAAEKAPDAGMFTPTIMTEAGEVLVSRFRSHSLTSEFVEGAQTGPVTRLFPFGETPIFPDDTTSEPDWVSFSAVMIRNEAIEQAGPMDEGFFLYYEDCEYSHRITRLGYGIRFVPEAVFTHEPSSSTKLREMQGETQRLPEYYYRSRAYFFRKKYGAIGPAAANMAWLAGRAIALLRGVAGRPAPRLCKNRYSDMWIGWRGEAS